VALLAVLMLRGPQTVAELRANASGCTALPTSPRWKASSNELAERKEPPRAVLLPRAPGAREARWAHLLCGEVRAARTRALADTPESAVTAGELGGAQGRAGAPGRSKWRRCEALVQRLKAGNWAWS
jgi:uncharacterized protein YceH (UPF0502 family)